MQHELWLKAKLQVLGSLKPVSAMRDASSNPDSAGDASVCATKEEGVGAAGPISSLGPITPTKPANPIKASRTHQELHKELLMAHRKPLNSEAEAGPCAHCTCDLISEFRGLGVSSKPELQLVLERRQRERTQKEAGEQGRTPLELELLRRQQRQQEVERQREKEREDTQVPELVKVRQNLRKTGPKEPPGTQA
ncbi:protein FAM107B isoform X1 [Lepisosteus oculatus]|uniref:protein FAM107B isoform X1 n=1 Tax=Lepisosteus oculatus TaxID=7918 RepID=UPI0035F50836